MADVFIVGMCSLVKRILMCIEVVYRNDDKNVLFDGWNIKAGARKIGVLRAKFVGDEDLFW